MQMAFQKSPNRIAKGAKSHAKRAQIALQKDSFWKAPFIAMLLEWFAIENRPRFTSLSSAALPISAYLVNNFAVYWIFYNFAAR